MVSNLGYVPATVCDGFESLGDGGVSCERHENADPKTLRTEKHKAVKRRLSVTITSNSKSFKKSRKDHTCFCDLEYWIHELIMKPLYS